MRYLYPLHVTVQYRREHCGTATQTNLNSVESFENLIPWWKFLFSVWFPLCWARDAINQETFLFPASSLGARAHSKYNRDGGWTLFLSRPSALGVSSKYREGNIQPDQPEQQDGRVCSVGSQQITTLSCSSRKEKKKKKKKPRNMSDIFTNLRWHTCSKAYRP